MKNYISEENLLAAPFLNQDGLPSDIGNLLVLAPHPDDESLGCGGLITLLKKADKSVKIVFLTSGDASHLNSKSHSSENLALIRQNEAKTACELLGVNITDLLFLRLKDSKLPLLNFDDLKNVSNTILDRFSEFDSLALPWRRDPHDDHRVTYQIGEIILNLLRKKVTKIEYPIWLWKNGIKKDWPMVEEVSAYRLDISKVRIQKKLAIQSHSTQLGKVIHDDPEGFVLTEELLAPFLSDFEYYFITKSRNISTIGVSYFEALYSFNSDPWDFENSSYEHDKYRASIDIFNNHTFKNGLEIGCSIGVQTCYFAKICKELLAVDISNIAVGEAKKRCSAFSNITIKALDITKYFPTGNFDLITLCEVGYYFDKKTLFEVFESIEQNLISGGNLLFVHWTSYVPKYPLSGDLVHTYFEHFIQNKPSWQEEFNNQSRLFRIQLWKKNY